MNEDEARAVARHLAPAATDGARIPELAWTIQSTLEELDFGDVDIFLPDVDANVAHWLSAGMLFTANASITGDDEPQVHVTSQRLCSADWTIELTCSSALLGPMRHPGLWTKWTFRSTNGKLIEMEGQVDLAAGDHPGQANSAEAFARLMAKQIGWAPSLMPET